MPGPLLLLSEQGGGDASHIRCCEQRHDDEGALIIEVSVRHESLPWPNGILTAPGLC